ncbi:hypothetical protein [Streptomyces griseus]|uniref:hypothetical protein n=1 Tax=Streptomyces griseus TaxID=1911 RepID=UPI00131A7225|nr:hypothetical protein [Streptomyces griseus]
MLLVPAGDGGVPKVRRASRRWLNGAFGLPPPPATGVRFLRDRAVPAPQTSCHEDGGQHHPRIRLWTQLRIQLREDNGEAVRELMRRDGCSGTIRGDPG